MEICEAHPENVEDWDLPFAWEALARAHDVAGNAEEARRWEQKARELGQQIRDPEDREQLAVALASL